jgi:hypothetical protein
LQTGARDGRLRAALPIFSDFMVGFFLRAACILSALAHPFASSPSGSDLHLTFFRKVLIMQNMTVRYALVLACCGVATLTTAACSQSNNLLFGEVQATVGTHTVVVTDCYQASVPSPRKSGDDYRFTPCRDADVAIHGEVLSVNGQPYGRLNPRDSVLVDHGKASVDRHLARNGPEK